MKIIDTHIHLKYPFEAKEIANLREDIIYFAMLFPNKTNRIYNKAFIDGCKKYKNIYPIALLDDNLSNYINGAIGVKEHIYEMKIKNLPSEFDNELKWCEKSRFPLLTHLGGSSEDDAKTHFRKILERIFIYVNKCPNLKIILAHSGKFLPKNNETNYIDLWKEFLFVLIKWTNVNVDISCLNKKELQTIINIYPSDRILYASDFPYEDGKKSLERLLSLKLDDVKLNKILYENAKKIFCLNDQ